MQRTRLETFRQSRVVVVVDVVVSCDAPLSLGGDAPPDKGSLTAPGKGSAGDIAAGEGAAGASKSHLVRSRIWSTNSCTCGSTDTPLAFSCGAFGVKSRTPV